MKKNNQHRTESVRLYEYSRGNQENGVKGTLWTAYNGITELADHHWSYDNRAQRLSWLWFGEGERIKVRAFEEAVKLAN